MSELNILIAEPSKTGRHIFTQLTSKLGVTVTFTNSAKETYSEATKKQYDLICLSQKLPDDEGINVCATLRQYDQYKTTTILLVTPQKSSVDYDIAFSSGVTQLIGKHELHRFVHSVELLIERSKPIEGHVLVVEDSRSQAEFVAVLIKNMGLEVSIVSSAEQAIKDLDKTEYCLIIVDVVLAGNMTGVELVDYIRSMPEPRNRVRVLAMSAYEDSSRRIKLFNLGIDDFISKPILREELIARVRGLLSQHYIIAANQENERLNKSLSQLLNNSPDVIARFDINGNLLYMNPTMELELGVKQGEEVGKHFTQLGLSETALTIYHKVIEELKANKKVIHYQLNGKNDIDYDIQFSPEIVDRKVISFISSARNITELTGLQKKLMASSKEVEQASQAKTRFLATMSHELRTPLNAISGFGQLMRQKLRSEQQVNSGEFLEHLDLIGDNATNLTTLIDDVLHLSQIEAGGLSSHLQNINVVRLLEGIRAGFNLICAKRKVVLNINYDLPEPPKLVLDKAKTLTILSNLIDNAIKFSHYAGKVNVSVSSLDGHFSVKVQDNGIGFPDSFQNKLYSPFEQVDNSRTRDCGGTGLGLSIVDKFTKYLGGSIEIQSREGKGTLCKLTLPLGDKPDDGMEDELDVVDTVVNYHFSGQKILVVEDSIVNQQLMRACLDNYGLNVKIAENGLEGIEQCIRWQPDLVLMDMHMPKMDGLEATCKIRQIEAFKNLPIFGLSADVHKAYIEKAIASGINEYLTKPVDFNQLCELLNQYLSACVPTSLKYNAEHNNMNNKEPVMSEISVLNIDKGISYAANNNDLFKQLLSTFVKQYEQSGEQLRALANSGDNDNAMKLAHTMKGVCSTLGMDSLSEVAKRMQSAFANIELVNIEQDLLSYDELLVIAIKEASAYCNS